MDLAEVQRLPRTTCRGRPGRPRSSPTRHRPAAPRLRGLPACPQHAATAEIHRRRRRTGRDLVDGAACAGKQSTSSTATLPNAAQQRTAPPPAPAPDSSPAAPMNTRCTSKHVIRRSQHRTRNGAPSPRGSRRTQRRTDQQAPHQRAAASKRTASRHLSEQRPDPRSGCHHTSNSHQPRRAQPHRNTTAGLGTCREPGSGQPPKPKADT